MDNALIRFNSKFALSIDIDESTGDNAVTIYGVEEGEEFTASGTIVWDE